jgi:hypothetical protein
VILSRCHTACDTILMCKDVRANPLRCSRTQGWVVGMVCGYKPKEITNGNTAPAVHEVRYDNRQGRFLENLASANWEFDYHEGVAGLPLARWEDASGSEKEGGVWMVGRLENVDEKIKKSCS